MRCGAESVVYVCMCRLFADARAERSPAVVVNVAAANAVSVAFSFSL